MSERMSVEDYQLTCGVINALAMAVDGMDLVGYLRRIEDAEIIGPVVDPTLFQAGHKNLADIKRLADSLLPFKAQVMKLRLRFESGENKA